MSKQGKELICSICQLPIPPQGPKGTWKLGCNAEPVNSGRCCKDCDDNIVLPARMNMDRRMKDAP